MTSDRAEQVSERDGWTWIVLPESIDMDNYRRIEELAAGLLAQGRRRLALDLGRVDYLYSSAIGLLMRLRRKAVEARGRIALVNVSARVREVLASVNIHRIFGIYASETEFVALRGESWRERMAADAPRFLAAIARENGIGRITLNGHMTGYNDLSPFDLSLCGAVQSGYVFDLTGLESIDSEGLKLFHEALAAINGMGMRSIAYGAREGVKEVLVKRGINQLLEFCQDERKALEKLTLEKTPVLARNLTGQ